MQGQQMTALSSRGGKFPEPLRGWEVLEKD